MGRRGRRPVQVEAGAPRAWVGVGVLSGHNRSASRAQEQSVGRCTAARVRAQRPPSALCSAPHRTRAASSLGTPFTTVSRPLIVSALSLHGSLRLQNEHEQKRKKKSTRPQGPVACLTWSAARQEGA